MQERHYSIKKNEKILQKSLFAAGQFVTLFYKLNSPSDEQYFILAAAHYTLALQEDLSRRRCKMHLNSCITLLQNLSRIENPAFLDKSPNFVENLPDQDLDKNPYWNSLLANAYARRAELYEEEDGLDQALNDYLRVLELFLATCSALENHKTLISDSNPLIGPNPFANSDLYFVNPDINPKININNPNINIKSKAKSYRASDEPDDISLQADIPLQIQIDKMLETRLNELAFSIRPYIPIGIDRLSIAQTCICIADLLLNQFFLVGQYKNLNIKPPMFYLDIAFLNLSKLKNEEDETFMTAAYAYQIAALTVEAQNFKQATHFYHLALRQIFKASSKAACQTLGDIYNSLGLLYEQHAENIIIEKENNIIIDHAMIYFATAMFFYPTHVIPENQSHNSMDFDEFSIYHDVQESLSIVFDSIHRALDPYPYPISLTVLRDFIDSLIFAYFCIQNNTLPNQALAIQLKTGNQLDNFAQHIYCLLTAFNRRINRQEGLQLFINEHEIKSSHHLQESLNQALNRPNKNNVVELKKKEATV